MAILKIIGVIPARLGSTRLSEKVLRPINGRPMVEWVWRQASRAAKLSDLVVACDDAKVYECVEAFGGRVVMTRREHPNGSSRIAEVAQNMPADVFINIQGDEPTIRPEAIDQLAGVFDSDPSTRVATLAVRKDSRADFENPNIVKVVADAQGRALYFSRSPVPYYRESTARFSFLKHLGLYGYRREFLLDFVNWPPGTLEEAEKLEQLRILERGVPIRVLETPYDSWSVDTEEDLALAETMTRAGK